MGLFENPYLNPEETTRTVGKPAKTANRDHMQMVLDFAFGLNWQGVINDERVKKYSH